MKNLIAAIFILDINSGSLQAQNINVSQFDNNPLFVNPGMTGDFDGRLRANGYYRNQWTNLLDSFSLQTYTFSADARFLFIGPNSTSCDELVTPASIDLSATFPYKITETATHVHKI